MKKLISILTATVLCFTLIGGISAFAKDVYPDGMTMVDFENYTDGDAMLGDTATWNFTNLPEATISTRDGDNEYVTIKAPKDTTKTYSRIDRVINVDYRDDEGKIIAEKRFMYFTAEIAGWQDKYSSSTLSFSVLTDIARADSCIYLGTKGTVVPDPGAANISIVPIEEPQDHFYKIDIILDLEKETYYLYVDGAFIKSYTEDTDTSGAAANSNPIKMGKKITSVRIEAAVKTAGEQRTFSLDNVGYKFFSDDDYTAETVIDAVFAEPDLRFVGAYKGKDKWVARVRAAAKEKAGTILIAAYDSNDKLIEVIDTTKTPNAAQKVLGDFSKNSYYYFDVKKDVENTAKIRAFFLNSLGGLTPLDESMTVLKSEFYVAPTE